MKKFISFSLCLLIFLMIPFKAFSYSAKSMVLMESSTNTVLDSVNCDKRLPMASTTKIMTALVVLRYADIDSIIKVPPEACGVEGTSVYLKTGECLSVLELLYALLLESGNDAAVALAIGTFGSLESFVFAMNDMAVKLGLKDTNFTNPSGLPDDNHYTTARELAVIASVALENTIFSEIVSSDTYKSASRSYKNHNKLLKMYDYAVGVKTGYTKKAGRCLVSAAKKDGITLICVTLSDPDDWLDHIAAFEYGFSKVRYTLLAKSGDVRITLFTPDGKGYVACNIDDIYGPVFTGSDVDRFVFAPRFVYPPKACGQTVGSVSFCSADVSVAVAPLVMTEAVDIKIKKQFFLFDISNYIKGLIK